MKVESPDFDKAALMRLVQSVYALDVARLDFVPKGEESHSYIATTVAGEQYFVKVHMASASPALAACYRYVHHLSVQAQQTWIVGPHLTVTGDCLASLGERAVAVFGVVTGVTKAPGELSAAQRAQFARQLATLHNTDARAAHDGLPVENFTISFNSWLHEVLEAVERPHHTTHAWAQAAYDLIHREKPHILSLLAQVEASGATLRAADLPLAVTHGDLASHNIIQDEQGNLLLIDWGKLCLAPVARDLVALWGNGNVALLEAYFRLLAEPPPQLRTALTYYWGYGCLATVTDYGSWLLLEEASSEEAENAWRGLQQALPVNLPQMQATTDAICASAATTIGEDGKR